MISIKTGIYGGTFNPIHLGHIHILREFVQRLELDRVLLIPTGTPPHKSARFLAQAEDRFAMCALAAQELPEVPVEVSDMELRRSGESYTADTLEELAAEYPGDRFFLLMGEDMFLTLHRWYRPETICRLAELCASPRSGDGFCKLNEEKRRLEKDFSARCHLEDISYLPVSSTEIRELARQGKSLRGLLPPEVEQYIRDRALYGAAGGNFADSDSRAGL